MGNDQAVFGRGALDMDVLQETSCATIGAVVIAGGAAVTLFYLTLQAISDAPAPVVDATGRLVKMTLLANHAFVIVIVGGIILWFGDLRPRDVGLVRADLLLGVGITVGTWILVQVTGVTALIL
jgi:hypothetical protein